MCVCVCVCVLARRDSSVGIGTGYGLGGPGIDSRWGRDFSSPVQTGLGACPASHTMGTGYFLGVKRLGRGVNHPLYLAPRLKLEKTYSPTPPLDLRGLFRGELYLFTLKYIYIYIYIYIHVSSPSVELRECVRDTDILSGSDT